MVLPRYATHADLAESIEAGECYWNTTDKKSYCAKDAAANGSSAEWISGSGAIGEVKSFAYEIPESGMTDHDLLSENLPVGAVDLPILDGVLKVDLEYRNDTYYSAALIGVGSGTTVTYQTFATQSNENSVVINKPVGGGVKEFVDANDVTLWTYNNSEVLTTNVRFMVGGEPRWYEIVWWGFEKGASSNVKTMNISVTRKL